VVDPLLRPNPLTAAWPTDGCSACGAEHDPARGAVAEPRTPPLRDPGLPWPVPAAPIPARFAGRRLADGTTRVVILDDGLPALFLPGETLGEPFDWGRPTLGARRLAFHLLREQLGRAAARALHRPFYRGIVARWPLPGWAITTVDLTDWALRHGAEVEGGAW
jgi:hypothetical protein